MTNAWLACIIRPGLLQQASKPTDDASVELDELAFAELITYIDECLEVEEPAVLTLSDFVRFLYLQTT